MESSQPLAPGVWTVLPTPFIGPSLEIDEQSLARVVEHALSAGATGLLALGVMGEAASLTPTERRTVLEVVTRAAPNVPVVVGVTAREPTPAIHEARQAVDVAGAQLAAVMLQVPSPLLETTAGFLRAIHHATGAAVVVQDHPASSGVHIAAEDIALAVAECDFVVAVKCEAPPTPVAIQHVREATSVAAFGGLGGVNLVDELQAGASGAMTGFSYPEGLLAAINGFSAAGFAGAAEAFAPWLPLANFESQPGVSLAVRKALLRARGLIRDARVRPPATELPERLLAAVDSHIERAEALLRTGQETSPRQ